MSDQQIKDAYLKGLKFDDEQNLEPEQPQQIVLNTDDTRSTTTLQEQLIQKLLNGEITNEAFLQATNLLKSKNKTQRLTGYI